MSFDKYTPEQVEKLKQDFVGNECDTDEYRETQPAKGMRYVANLLELIEGMGTTEHKVIVLCEKWLHAMLNDPMYEGAGEAAPVDGGWPWYAGAKELTPLMELYFDYMWAKGEHPYYDDEAALDEWLEDTKEE
jgi:hypothetical protein